MLALSRQIRKKVGYGVTRVTIDDSDAVGYVRYMALRVKTSNCPMYANAGMSEPLLYIHSNCKLAKPKSLPKEFSQDLLRVLRTRLSCSGEHQETGPQG